MRPTHATPAIGRHHLAIACGVTVPARLVLLGMGRVPFCTCGDVKLWHGVVYSAENSQHVTDWYTFSHVLHGFAFYALLWLAVRRWSIGARFVAATALEAGWEILENTDFIIDRYREVTISLDYFGDSVLNSVSDIAAMMAGFAIARRAPWWITVSVALIVELYLLYAIRDNLTLNVLMLLYSLDAVRVWQSGG
jgi:hypothetical protein